MIWIKFSICVQNCFSIVIQRIVNLWPIKLNLLKNIEMMTQHWKNTNQFFQLTSGITTLRQSLHRSIFSSVFSNGDFRFQHLSQIRQWASILRVFTCKFIAFKCFILKIQNVFGCAANDQLNDSNAATTSIGHDWISSDEQNIEKA